MIRRITTAFTAALLICFAITAVRAASLSPTLAAKLGQTPDATSIGTIIVSFRTTNGLNDSHLNVCALSGLPKASRFRVAISHHGVDTYERSARVSERLHQSIGPDGQDAGLRADGDKLSKLHVADNHRQLLHDERFCDSDALQPPEVRRTGLVVIGDHDRCM